MIIALSFFITLLPCHHRFPFLLVKAWEQLLGRFHRRPHGGSGVLTDIMSSFMSFLTLGLTADAAAAHRHEFSSNISTSTTPNFHMKHRSSRPSPQTPPRTPPLIPPQAQQSRTPPHTPSQAVSRISSTSNPAHILTTIESQSASTLGLASEVTSGEDQSLEQGSMRKPRSLKTKTTYHLAAPPPSNHINRIQSVVRPNRVLLLQLQRLHASSRPVPSFDVFPALAFATKPKRKRPLGLQTLGCHDLVILSSEEYTDQGGGEGNEDGDLSTRQFIASISHITRKDKDDDGVKALIEFPGGVIWEASQKTNGSYEFVSRQENGETLMARWVLRTPNNKQRSSQAMGLTQGEKRFQFSMINANTRRHPILATMTGQRMDINDQYHIPMSLTSRPGSSTGISRLEAMSINSHSDLEGEKLLVQTDEFTKTLIVVTGTWVTLREGFNGRFWFDEPFLASSPSRATSTSKIQVDTPKLMRRGTSLRRQATGVNGPLEGGSQSTSTGRATSAHGNSKRKASSGTGYNRISSSSTRASSPESTIKLESPSTIHTPIGRMNSSESQETKIPSSAPSSTWLRRSLSKFSKPDKDRNRNMIARTDNTGGIASEGRTLKQKLSRVFSILHRK